MSLELSLAISYLVLAVDCVRFTQLSYDAMEHTAQYLSFGENLRIRTLGSAYNRIFNIMHGELIDDVSELEAYSSVIDQALFRQKDLDRIFRIGKKYKLNPLYRLKLVNSLRNAYLHSIVSLDTNITVINFQDFMNGLNIKPMTVEEYERPKFKELPPYIQILIIMSRTIAHPFVFSDTSPNTTSRSIDNYWNNQSFLAVKYYKNVIINRDSYFVFRIFYDHCYMEAAHFDHLPRWREMPYLPQGSKRIKLLHTLMNEWNFIPWSLPQEVIANNSMLMSVIFLYDMTISVTFWTVLRRYLFSENFMAELHSRFIFSILRYEHIHFDNFDGYQEELMIMRRILKRLFRFLALPSVHEHVAFRQIVELIYRKKGSCLLKIVSEFDPVSDFPPLDLSYLTLLINILTELNATDCTRKELS